MSLRLLRGLTEPVAQGVEEMGEFTDACTCLVEFLGRPLVGASLGSVGGHELLAMLQSDKLSVQNSLEEPCLGRLGSCDGTRRG
jgi:hypothetical protein